MQENAINKQSVFTNKLCLHNNDLWFYGQLSSVYIKSRFLKTGQKKKKYILWVT